MAGISAAMVKELRDQTGAGMMDCKSALGETGGDMEAAVDWLRKKGLSKAAKKSGRTAAEGLIALAAARNGASAKAVLVEVNSETDFVARNEIFQKMVAEIAKTALATNGDVAAVRAAPYPGAGKSVEEHIAEMVGQIGENMALRRSAMLSVPEGAIGAYVHGQVVDGAGKIGVLVGLKSSGDKTKLEALGRQLAMHVAAARPLSGRIEELDPTVVAREKSVLAEQARSSGKPEAIIDKMVEGRLRKFYEESVLLEQIFVVDGETRVSKVIENAAKDVGAPVEFAGFARLELGEGVDKTSDED
ncbi:MAG TPA: translation elongation factor Ts [Parvularculaceae bacterium]|nr:translation elongation factor Ts [Parvularculaceae bacterium]